MYEGVNKLPLCVNACPIDSGYACYVCGEYNDLPHLREITFEEIAGWDDLCPKTPFIIVRE